MIRAIFILAYRTFFHNRFYYFSLVTGFSLAFAASGIVFLFVANEFAAEDIHRKAPRVHRVLMNDVISFEKGPVTFPNLAPALKDKFPAVVKTTHLYHPGRTFIRGSAAAADEVFKEQGLLYADENFFDIFDFALISGNRATALRDPNNLVLTQSAAARYFKEEVPIGKVLTVQGGLYTVAGVMEDVPSNGHLSFSMLASKTSLPPAKFVLEYPGFTYVLLDERAKADDVVAAMNGDQASLLPFVGERKSPDPFALQPLKEIYFAGGNFPTLAETGVKIRSKPLLFILATIGAVILGLSMLNYLSFNHSRIIFQQKQLFVKRIFGASRLSFLLQAVFEAAIIVLCSIMLAMLVLFGLVGVFNNLLSTGLTGSMLMSSRFIIPGGLALLVIVFMLGLLSYLFSPAFALQPGGYSVVKHLNGRLRALNVIFLSQLTLSIALVAFSLLVIRQIRFTEEFDPGFQLAGIVEIDLSSLPAGYNPQTLKAEYARLPEFVSGSVCTGSPLSGRWRSSVKVADSEMSIDYSSYTGDSDFVETLGFRVIEPGDFHNTALLDSGAILVNETAARVFDLDERYIPRNTAIKLPGKVVGVIEDFQYSSLKDPVGPAIVGHRKFDSLEFGGARLVMRFSRINSEVISKISNVWKAQQLRDLPLEYEILSQRYQSLHAAETKQSSLFSWGTAISVVICIAGLLGLSLFHAQVRTKEIAIRKTVGADTAHIVSSVLLQLLKGILMAAVVAFPMTYYLFRVWIDGFAYKVGFSWLIVFQTLVVVTVLMVLTIIYQVFSAARRNPAQVLKRD